MSNIFTRISRWFSNLFGGNSQEQKVDDASGRSAVYLPDSNTEKENETKGRRSRRQDRNGNQQKSGFRRDEKPAFSQKKGNFRQDRTEDRKNQPNKPEKKSQPQNKKQARPEIKNISMEGWKAPESVRENPDDVLFQDFQLDKRILRALLEKLAFKKCSPIQGQSLAHTLAGEDLAGKAQTGTGKTAAFLITVLQRFLEEEKDSREAWQPLAVILAPTRELAIQIANDAADISAFCPDFRTVAVYGGMDYDKQMSELVSGVDLVVATPGRLIDYLRKHAVDMSRISIAVIDEADRMLDMGFIPDVKRIMSYLPAADKRQTMLFSATLSHDIMELASRWMRPNPTVIEIEPEHVVADGIDETVYAATSQEKLAIMLWLFKHEDCRRVLIFRNRKKDVEALQAVLQRCGVQCEMLTGDVEQRKRLRILDEFRAGKVNIIVATDVAGRGIHVDDVSHVINYDLPYEAEDYVHRVGRTARAGHKGRAISFADEDCAFVIPEIEKYIERPLKITQPDEQMLVMPEKLSNISSARATGIHRSGNNGGFHQGGFHRRSFGHHR